MADKNRDLSSKKQKIREMAKTGTDLLHVCDGKVGNVAAGIGATLVSPPLSVGQVETISGILKAPQQYRSS